MEVFLALAIEDSITAPDGYGYIQDRVKRSLGLTFFSRHRAGGPLRVRIENCADGVLPLIWSATFDEASFVWFRTSKLAVARGGTHLHWSGLGGAGNHVRLIGGWGTGLSDAANTGGEGHCLLPPGSDRRYGDLDQRAGPLAVFECLYGFDPGFGGLDYYILRP